MHLSRGTGQGSRLTRDLLPGVQCLVTCRSLGCLVSRDGLTATGSASPESTGLLRSRIELLKIGGSTRQCRNPSERRVTLRVPSFGRYCMVPIRSQNHRCVNCLFLSRDTLLLCPVLRANCRVARAVRSGRTVSRLEDIPQILASGPSSGDALHRDCITSYLLLCVNCLLCPASLIVYLLPVRARLSSVRVAVVPIRYEIYPCVNLFCGTVTKPPLHDIVASAPMGTDTGIAGYGTQG